MSWKDRLRPPSFRGVPFSVVSHDTEAGGRAGVVHEYSGRDGGFPEDTGGKPWVFPLAAYVIGDDYMQQRDRLIAACNEEGPGLLVHPYLGEFSVVCTQVNISENSRDGRMCRFALRFVKDDGNRYPASVKNNAAAITTSIGEAETAISDRFVDVFSIAGQPGYVADAATQTITNLAGELSRLAGNRISGPYAASIRNLIAEAPALAVNPGSLSGRITEIVANAAIEKAASTSPILTIDALRPLTSYALTLPAVPTTTTTRLRQAANQTAIASLVERSSLIEMARTTPGVTFTDRAQAIAVRDDLADRFAGSLESASAAREDAVFASMRALRSATVTYLSAQAPSLAKVVQITTKATEPALVAAYRLYGTADQADQLIARNRLRHPGFVPGGAVVETLTAGAS